MIGQLLRDLWTTVVILVAAGLFIWCLAEFTHAGFDAARDSTTEAQQVVEQ